ncbi:glycoside hydrolase family 3 N-terminal domain-containing protein [Aerosakkonemataceae cyanobacterium BLCC-F154]|uniref:beta-N-acetylhexosaminidase n=1 Tax=Floridaenema fluviatile BLCC-F154 TaxID=3153640 RepID=A0ABV4YFM4_9CYAN
MSNSSRLLRLFLAFTIFFLAFHFRTPAWSNWGNFLFWLIIIISSFLILTEIWAFHKIFRGKRRRLSIVILTLAWFSLSISTASQVKFLLTKQTVLNKLTAETPAPTAPPAPPAPPALTTPLKVANLGKHFVIGYRDFDELQLLVEKQGIAGVFITNRNVHGKTKAEIKQEIQTLQEIRKNQGLPPLLIAADQEGGIVSKLSPPLTKLPSLGRIIDDDKSIDQQKQKVIEYAAKQAQELAEIGVNLNFAPVVDLNKGVKIVNDKYSKITRRAISENKEVVAKVALWYCQTLEQYNVKCTIKHFPGLGRVNTDTHIAEAELNASVEELMNDDWVPFREVMKNTQAFTMIGHAKLMAVDPENAASFSHKVVTEIIRQNWQHNGVLITDDFGMQAVYGSKDGVANATVKSINAGVDLILLSYDKNLYYDAMYALMTAAKEGKLDAEVLGKSGERIDRLSSVIK